MNTTLVTPAAVAPVSIATALRHCRALQSEVDLLWLYLLAAVEKVEDYTGRSMITKTYRVESPVWQDIVGIAAYSPTVDQLSMSVLAINLPRTPLLVIDSLKY